MLNDLSERKMLLRATYSIRNLRRRNLGANSQYRHAEYAQNVAQKDSEMGVVVKHKRGVQMRGIPDLFNLLGGAHNISDVQRFFRDIKATITT